MAKDLTTLKTQATTIANETAEGANTAARVGGAIGDIVDWLEENGSTGGSSSGGGSLTSGSVTTDKIKDGAVTTSKIATNAVTEDKLSAALQERLNNLSTGSGDIATGAVTTEKIASNAVTTDKLATDIQDRLSQIVKHYKYEGVVVTGSSVPTGTGNAFVIAQTEGVYTNFKGANGSSLTVSASNTDYTNWIAIIKTDSSGSRAYWTVEYICVHVGSSSSGGSGGTVEGTVTHEMLDLDAVWETNILNANVTTRKLADGAVTAAKMASGAIAATNIQSQAVTEAKMANLSVSSRCLIDKSVTFDKLAADIQEKLNSLTAGSGDGTVAAHTHNISDINLSSEGFYDFPRAITVSNTGSTTSSNSGIIISSEVGYLYNNWSNNCLGIMSDKTYFDGIAYFAKGYQTASDIRLKDILENECLLQLAVIANAPAIKFAYKGDKTKHRGTTAQYWQEVTGDDFVGKTRGNDGKEYLNLQTDSLSLTIGLSLARHLVEANQKIAQLEERIKELENKQTE